MITLIIFDYIGNHYCLHRLNFIGNHAVFDNLGSYVICWHVVICWQSGSHGSINFSSPSKYPMVMLLNIMMVNQISLNPGEKKLKSIRV